MNVIDERSKAKVSSDMVIRGIVAIYNVDDTTIYEYGYFTSDVNTILFYRNDIGEITDCISKDINENIIFSKMRGYYMMRPKRRSEALDNVLIKGYGDYPYKLRREYEAAKNLNNFKDKQRLISNEIFPISQFIKYTFGVEFETSEGYVPQDICFRDGLIPLRDGSITGIEYSTVVLDGNNGLNLLRQQCESLRFYTNFNKNCALHIHFGGYPITEKYIFVLYRILYWLQDDIEILIPPYSFHTGKYKDNGKEYCSELPFFKTFNDFYTYMSDNKTRYMGDLYQAHPDDIDHEHKWNITSRYHNFNFINMLFYDGAKTLELRFLRPSFNFNKIMLWIAIFNGILKFAENEAAATTLMEAEQSEQKYRRLGLSQIMSKVYPPDIAEYIGEGMIKLKCIVQTQVNNGDNIGLLTSIEDELF